MLLKHNADRNLATNAGGTPISIAVLQGCAAIVQVLLQHTTNLARAFNDDYERREVKHCQRSQPSYWDHDIATLLLLNTRKCDTCQNSGTKSVCNSYSEGRYCDHECQESHWKEQ